MKKLRKTQNAPIGVFVTGEYGEKTKRPHWHAIIFGWIPSDATKTRTTERGDSVFNSKTLDKLWGQGRTELGSVTFESAGYCARYAAKKLCHGQDQNHEYHPISRKSSKHAIGKKWLQRYWPDVFNHGKIILKDGTESSIPRYYEKWLKEHQPEAWEAYVTQTKANKIKKASEKSDRENHLAHGQDEQRRIARGIQHVPQTTRLQARKIIKEQKFKELQKFLKL